MSLIAAVGSLGLAYFETVDWWNPQTITGTRIGIEDFLLGFSNGGIAAVLYEEIFRKRLYRRSLGNHSKGLLLLVTFTCLLFYFLFNEVKTTTFYACIIALSVYCTIMLYYRRDLFFSSLINGALMVLVSFPTYFVIQLLSPGAIESTYRFNFLSGILILGVPIEDLIFYYFFGFMVALMYEYWQGLRLRSMVNKR